MALTEEELKEIGDACSKAIQTHFRNLHKAIVHDVVEEFERKVRSSYTRWSFGIGLSFSGIGLAVVAIGICTDIVGYLTVGGIAAMIGVALCVKAYFEHHG